ncbi:MAG TPA: hypothetical protein VIU11_22980 [Nakamurella sp.]
MTPQVTPTANWLAALPELPRLAGAAATAERLLLLLHYGVDWSTWVGDHRIHYWSSLLPDRVTKATYRSATLDKWWSQAAVDLQSAPRSAAERAEVALLLREQAGPVLTVLRDETPALLLRIRLTTDAVRQRRLTLELQEPQP